MQVAASISMGRLAPKHSLNIDGIRKISPNVSPALIKDDVILIDNLRTTNGNHLSIDEYTDQKLQPYIDEYNEKQRRQDRRINTGYTEWHRNNGILSQGRGELAYEVVLQYGTHDDLGGEYYSPQTSPERKAELRSQFESVYRDWLADLQKHYPHMTVVYAVIHFSEEEGTPHMHACFQPLSECNRGLSKQVSIGRALAQDGIERLESRAEAQEAGGYQLSRFFQEFHHKYQNPSLEKLGYTIKAEQHGLKHIEKDGYSVVMAAAHQQAHEVVQAAEQRQERVTAETEKAKAQTLSIVYRAQEAAEAARVERARAEEAKANAELERAQAEAQAESAREEAEAAQAERVRAENARMLAEQQRAQIEAETSAFKERTRAEANIRCAELEGQLAQAQAYIEQQNGLIAKLQQKLEQIRAYLMEYNAVQHFWEWVQRQIAPEQAQEQSQDWERE